MTSSASAAACSTSSTSDTHSAAAASPSPSSFAQAAIPQSPTPAGGVQNHSNSTERKQSDVPQRFSSASRDDSSTSCRQHASSSAEDAPQLAAHCAQDSKLEYLQDRYGSETSHIHLSREEVDTMVDKALQDSPTVTYLLQSLKQGGCGVGRPFFHVTRCADTVGGGFSTEYGVILCHNRLSTYKEVELALAHELVHAYDFCRASNLDFTNCLHHACTEIRAANLSGDCSLGMEFKRGHLTEALIGQHKRCVERRALISVSLNPYCQDGKAEAAVSQMMKNCFRDTDPFPRVPGL